MVSNHLTEKNEPKMESLAQPKAEIQFLGPWGPPGMTLWTLGTPKSTKTGSENLIAGQIILIGPLGTHLAKKIILDSQVLRNYK